MTRHVKKEENVTKRKISQWQNKHTNKQKQMTQMLE